MHRIPDRRVPTEDPLAIQGHHLDPHAPRREQGDLDLAAGAKRDSARGNQELVQSNSAHHLDSRWRTHSTKDNCRWAASSFHYPNANLRPLQVS